MTENTLHLGDLIVDLYNGLEDQFEDDRVTSAAVAAIVNELLSNADDFSDAA